MPDGSCECVMSCPASRKTAHHPLHMDISYLPTVLFSQEVPAVCAVYPRRPLPSVNVATLLPTIRRSTLVFSSLSSIIAITHYCYAVVVARLPVPDCAFGHVLLYLFFTIV